MIKYTIFSFKNKVHKSQLKDFYNTVIDHSPDRSDSKKYQKIQTKFLDNILSCLAIEESVVAVKESLKKLDKNKLYGKEKIILCDTESFSTKMAVKDTVYLYSLKNWIAFVKGHDSRVFNGYKDFEIFKNEIEIKNNYKEIKKERIWQDEELRSFLELLLVHQISFLFKSLNNEKLLPQNAFFWIQPIIKSNISFLSNKHTTFDIYFTSNLDMPNGFGVGKKISYGYGTLQKLSKSSKEL